MFNFHPINIAEVNSPTTLPEPPALSILPSEDVSVLTWNSPAFTDFFTLYWSENPFTSITDPGVHAISEEMPTPDLISIDDVSYTHIIPANFSLFVLYYRVGAQSCDGTTLSNQVDNYNFKLAIYEELYKKTLEELTLRFTPEIRQQYEDSQLWKSFVQSLCSELAQSRFEIKEALKQLNLQKAVDVFLNMWNSVTGISRVNVSDTQTGLLRPETDDEYRKRLVDNVFWDKISNLALKKTMLLKLGREATVLDAGLDPTVFKTLPEASLAKLSMLQGLRYFPGESINFLFLGPSFTATCVSDDGTTLVYSDYAGPSLNPYSLIGGHTSSFYATPTGPLTPGLIELINQGRFDGNMSVVQWWNRDTGNEGPPDSTLRTLRPTAYTTGGLGGWDPVNPTYAYDTNLNSYASLQGGEYYSGNISELTLYGVPSMAGSATNLELKIRVRMPLSTRWASLAYSLDGGAAWLYPYTRLVGEQTTYFDGTMTVSLPLDQNLSNIRVRATNKGYDFDPESATEGFFPTYLYDVRVEGSGWPFAGQSFWTSEHGGAMKLQYGVASREYAIPTSLAVTGQPCTITFTVLAGTVSATLGTTSMASDLLATTVYTPGTYSIGPFPAPASYAWFRLWVNGSIVGYVDNVSCMGTGPSTSGTLVHEPLYNAMGFWVAAPGTQLTFVSYDGLTTNHGTFISNVGNVLTFQRSQNSGIPSQFDYVKAINSGVSQFLTVLSGVPTVVTSSNSNIHPKLLSNVYSVNLGVASLPDAVLNEIYDTISPLAAIGNVLIKILNDVTASFDDWDTSLESIPYGPIFMGSLADTGSRSTESDWNVGDQIFLDNQWTMGNSRKFYGNAGPDDIITLTRTT